MEAGKGTRGRPDSDSEPEIPLALCAQMLALRDFTTCRDFAHRIPRSDPNISGCVDRIIAITDVLGAAERRLNNNHLDLYAILKLRRDDAGNRELARRQFMKLVRLLDPTKNRFPFSDDALMRVREAWYVLSDPERRALYDREIENPQPPEPCRHGGAAGDAARNFSGGDPRVTFWTMCPYCWNLYEYEKIYEDCSLRCQNCQKTFHGVAVKPPAKEIAVEGGQQYYCYHASIPLRYPMSKDDSNNMGEQHFVYVSDDDFGNSSKKCGIGEREGNFQADGVGGAAENVMGNEELGMGKVGEGIQRQWSGRTELQRNNRGMRIKTVAKKIVGKRMRSQGYLHLSSDSDLDAEDGELEFTQGDGDIFVGLRSAE